MSRIAAVLFASFFGVVAVSFAETPSSYTHEIEQWRADRVARLTGPDGWLSLIGLEWLHEGANRVGSAANNDIVLKAGPAHLGTVTLAADGAVRVALDKDSGATVDGKPVAEAALVDDMHAAANSGPTIVRFGNASFFVIDRDGRKALRVKDVDAEARRGFLGIDYFPIDASWRIEADWVPFVPEHDLEIGTAIGTIDKVKVPGKAVFRRDGHTFELLPYQEEPGGELFFVIADKTSGKETYGAARFLYAALPAGGVATPGKVVLDFNKAYNPPCAFTPFATCPLAPPENRLDVAVTAGEKKYRGGHH
ncbi:MULTISPECIES: DUF1684 domain-containing protein [Rhodanobacter]|uniref:DUF1684 domain-containing protein n=1 Tax=Rhodanobacter hydrolyticus TaxID=2250595 RepID=A0ABW8JA39_9GAMM|nr:DUF1684 domain-containing protein [Rhodanobacter sp. 7MK24]MBD8880457.1 DUF1684 domain-containing protein [Rhodanobacter sp. 7MK24]